MTGSSRAGPCHDGLASMKLGILMLEICAVVTPTNSESMSPPAQRGFARKNPRANQAELLPSHLCQAVTPRFAVVRRCLTAIKAHRLTPDKLTMYPKRSEQSGSVGRGLQMSENAFDAVVIGSGLGGLTAAALLAKAGRKVCVIERNHSVGGAASAFKKGALTIEPALHQTADPHYPGDPKHAILKEPRPPRRDRVDSRRPVLFGQGRPDRRDF